MRMDAFSRNDITNKTVNKIKSKKAYIYDSWYPTYIRSPNIYSMHPTCIIMLPNIYKMYLTFVSPTGLVRPLLSRLE